MTQEVARNNGTPNYQQLKTAVKLHIDQIMRNHNLKVGNDVMERGSVTKSKKGNKAYVERKVGECVQWKAHGQCAKGDSCSFTHDTPASGHKDCSQRRKDHRLLLHPTRKQNRLTRETPEKAPSVTLIETCLQFNLRFSQENHIVYVKLTNMSEGIGLQQTDTRNDAS